ncbi:MAG: hypothetical protein JSR49_11705 [Proteobacteria bacterium]|nr:hypothetical protein [Pseudomonadota bacterium]
MAETRSTCPYCGTGCGHAFGGPRGGVRYAPQPTPLRLGPRA